MPTITQIVPETPKPETARAAYKGAPVDLLAKAGAPSRLTGAQAVQAAIESEWSTGWAARQIDRSRFEADPSWSLTRENLEPLIEGLPPEYWEEFSSAVGQDHALKIREQLVDLSVKRQKLAELGWKGTALRIGAAVIDPVDVTIGIAAGALTGGVGAAAEIATQANRLRRLVTAGVVGSASAIPVQAYLSANDPEQDGWDVLYAGLGGFGGGLLGGALEHRAAAIARKDLDFNAVEHAMGAASPRGIYSDPKLMQDLGAGADGRLYFKGHVTGERQRELLEHMIRTSPLDEEADAATIAELRAMDPIEAVNSLVDESNRRAIVSDLGPESLVSDQAGAAPASLVTDQAPLRLFYRGTDPERTDRIAEPFEAALGKTFAARAVESARMYGPSIETIAAKPEAKILDQESKEFWKVIGKKRPPNSHIGSVPGSLVDNVNNAIRKAQAAGYDAVSFTSDSDIGTVILNEGAFIRKFDPSPKPPPPPTDTRRAGDFFPERASTAPAIWRKVRHSFASILGDPEFDGSSLQFFASQAEDALPRAGGAPSQVAATAWVHREHRKILADAYRGMDNSFAKWAADPSNSVGPLNRLAKRRDFDEAVGRAMREDPSMIPAGPIKDAAAHARRAIDNAFDTAKRHGVLGFAELEKRADYFPRIYSLSAISKAQKLFGADEVERLFATAIQGVSPELDPEKAARIGRAMIQSITDPDVLTDTEKGLLTAGERGDLLEEVLRENGIDEDTILDVLYAVKPGSPEAATISRAKHRVRLDEGTSIETAQGRLSFSDLLDNNVQRVTNGYVRQLTGASAAHRTYQLVAKGPEDIVSNWQQAAGRLKNQLREAGVSDKKIEKALNLARTLDRSVRGLPMDEVFSKDARDWMRRVRAFNHIALSGGFGWAQLPEIANIVGENGIRAVYQQLPTLTRIFKTAREGGSLSDDLLRTIEATWGTGTDRIMGRFSDPLEDAADKLDMAGRRIDGLLHAGQRLANDISGAAPVTILSQRMAVASSLQWLWQSASRDVKLSADKLATIGLTEADWTTVKAAVRDEIGKAVRIERGPLLGKRVADFAPHKFKDQNAAALLIDSVDRWSKQVIQQTDIGNLPPFLSKDVGKLLFQFKTFAFTAWEKQLLRGVYAHDARTMTAFGLTTAAAGLVYTARTWVNAQGREDKEEWLRERLSDRNIIAAAFQNAGYSSLLPTFIESFNRTTGGPPIFTARHTGLETAISLDNNPTISNLNALYRTFGDALAPVLPWSESQTFTQKEAQQASRLIPFRNIIGLRNAIDSLIQKLPESEQ